MLSKHIENIEVSETKNTLERINIRLDVAENIIELEGTVIPK